VLFSATMPPRIQKIAETYQRNPVLVKIAAADTAAERARVRQTAYVVMRQHKANALGRVLDMEAPVATIVFCRTRGEVDELAATMNGRGYRAEALHGGMDQQQRDRVMGRLKDGTAELLVATDVAARGLDVDTLTHVVNYDVPSSPESYVHRIGRVGRAGREGVAITLAEPRQRRLLQNIERLTKQEIDIQKIPTVGDLRTRQIEATVDAIREATLSDDLEDYEQVLFELVADGNPDRDVALAAIKLFHQARGATIDEVEIPDASERKPRDRDRGTRDGGKDRKGGPKGQKRGNVGPGTGLIYVGVGRRGHIRPGDLVGCIANETALTGRDIGPIQISDHYSVVGVPEADVESTIAAINGTTIRGKRAKARRFVEKD
jgi:ATP-dependent RNA helicase DeaD